MEAAHHLRELLEINRQITSSLDVGVVLATVTRQAAALLRGEAAALFLRADGTLKVAAQHQVPGGARDVEVPLGPGAMAQIRDLGRAAGLDECVGVPLRLRSETIGVLAAYRRDGAAATSEDEALLSTLADQAAVALENAHVYRQLQTQAEALRESEARFRLAFDAAPIGVALVGTDGRFLRVNNVLCEMVGYSREELTGLTFQAITHPDDVRVDVAAAGRLVRGEIARYQHEKRYLRKDGGVVDVQLSVSIVRDGEGAPLYYISQIEDITERKKANEAVRRSEAQLRGLIERLPDGVLIHRRGRIVYVNGTLAALLGYADPAALVGTDSEQLYHPDDRPAVLERRRALESGVAEPPRELRVLRRDGSCCDVETTAIQVQFEDEPAVVVIVRDLAERKVAEREREEAHRRLRAVIDQAPVGIILSTDGRHWDANVRAQQLFGRPLQPSIDASQYLGQILDTDETPLAFNQLPGVRALRGEQLEGVEMRLRQPDGHMIPVLVNAARIPGGSAGPPGVVVAFEDISALKQLDRLRIEWSALIAHDLRQPLSSISLYAQLVAEQTAGDPALHGRVVLIRSLARRLNRMIQDLLDVTRVETRQLTLSCRPLDLAPLIREAADRMALEAPDRPIELDLRAAPTLVDADADRIAQVMDNLLTNAIKYGDAGTPIRVELEVRGDRVAVAVTNLGPGIAAEHIPHLFARFQRARDAAGRGIKGVGLGLYITRQLIAAHRGEIVAESVPGATTTFRFTLPLAAAVEATQHHG